jgi:hypothetical protein
MVIAYMCPLCLYVYRMVGEYVFPFYGMHGWRCQ